MGLSTAELDEIMKRPLVVIKMPAVPTTARFTCDSGHRQMLTLTGLGQKIECGWPCMPPEMNDIDLVSYD